MNEDETPISRIDRIQRQMLQHGGVDSDDLEWMAGIVRSVVEAEPAAWQWRSILGPDGWRTAAFSVEDPGKLNEQYEKRAVYAL